MKKQTNQRLQTILLATIATIFLLGAFGSTFAQNVGAPYGAREPRTCADKTSPKTGALSGAKAVDYVVCAKEEETGLNYLWLVEDVKVEVGKGRPYNPSADFGDPGIDVKSLIYPIRGSYKSYQCMRLYSDKTNTNRNCNYIDNPNAQGSCYRREFGEWKCTFTDYNSKTIAENVPPPGAAKQPAPTADRKTAPNNQPPKNEPQTENKIADNQAGLPAPDFSEMEQWFEIVRFEYPTPPNRKMTIIFKPKTEIGDRADRFHVEFFDKDGILVQSWDSSIMYSSPFSDTEKGAVGKVEAQVPYETLWKQVKSVKVVRTK
ncbi:MAG: hypothetical protein ACR2HG_10360 [Pyrinomonadaceae bacterium]